MTASRLTAPQDYGRRLGVSLGVALVLHVILAAIPLYRWLGGNPGDAGGVGGGSLPFAGTLLGAAVVVRAPVEVVSDTPPTEVETPSPDSAAPEAVVAPTNPTVDNLDDAALSVELLPPERAGSTGGSGTATSDGGVLSGSLQPLGGGGGAEIEMDLVPEHSKHPDPLTQIVLKRKIEDEVIVQVLVDHDGYVLDHRVLRSIPECPECTASAVDAALAHVFPPPTFEGQRTRAWVTLSWHFGVQQ